jgi:lipooligosaccharide transport system permease protein
MVTTVMLPRLIARGSAARIGAVTSRNLVAVRHSGYWLVVISGFFEPVPTCCRSASGSAA